MFPVVRGFHSAIQRRQVPHAQEYFWCFAIHPAVLSPWMKWYLHLALARIPFREPFLFRCSSMGEHQTQPLPPGLFPESNGITRVCKAILFAMQVLYRVAIPQRPQIESVLFRDQ